MGLHLLQWRPVIYIEIKTGQLKYGQLTHFVLSRDPTQAVCEGGITLVGRRIHRHKIYCRSNRLRMSNSGISGWKEEEGEKKEGKEEELILRSSCHVARITAGNSNKKKEVVAVLVASCADSGSSGSSNMRRLREAPK